MTQIRHLGFCAPDKLRERLDGVSAIMLGRTAAELRPGPDDDLIVYATATSIRILGRRVVRLEDEITMLEGLLGSLVEETAPSLLALHGVGVDTAASLLVAAGDNPERLRSEAAWAHLCGVAPIQASSGKVTRHRLNRGGDRNANQALWRIALCRMSSDDRTRTYVAAPHRRGQKQTRDHALPQALHRPRGLPPHPPPRLIAPGGETGPGNRLTPATRQERPHNDLPSHPRAPTE